MKITKYGHACLLVEEDKARLLIDPGSYSKGFEAQEGLTAVLITHQHADHLSIENLKLLKVKNPRMRVFADEGSMKVLEEQDGLGLDLQVVHAGEEYDVAGVKLRVAGTDHAVIHPTLPGIPNTGYLIAERLFVPGDNFTQPGVPVEVLAVPVGAPWLKLSEAIDYMLAVRPAIAIPYHDAVLAMPEMNSGLLERFAGPAGIEVRVVANGDSTEV